MLSSASCNIGGTVTEYYPYDIEVYPNVFTLAMNRLGTTDKWLFELSDRRNDLLSMVEILTHLADNNATMVGFNNINYDYPVIHHIMNHYSNITCTDIYNKSMSIINAPHHDRFNHIIWDRDRYVKQLDLYKIHHFDNTAKATSLKMLEFNMRSGNIQDLPFEPGTFLTNDQIDTLIKYNHHDVNETEKFFNESSSEISLRIELSEKFGKDMTNFNDKKIGVDYLITEIEKLTPGSCYTKVNGTRQPIQTHRNQIAFKDVIFPYVKFEHPEFIRIHDILKSMVITETKGAIKDLNCTIDGFTYVFGTGGIHGSIDPCTITDDDYYKIKDIDVTSYYPSLGIVNRIYPEHLGESFCDLYGDIKNQRLSYAKGTSENKMLKLSLNGSYGDSNNKYSPLYDPKYTMTITINGQLLLCMLAEQLMKIPDLHIIQINTDGVTAKYPRKFEPNVAAVCKWWEQSTLLDLEDVDYSKMFIRDVNNYIAVGVDGKIKRKGAYEYNKLEWNKNHSSLVVQKAAENALINNVPVGTFIYRHQNVMDYMLRTKVPRTSQLYLGDKQVQNTCRYYISIQGDELYKMMPPLKGKVNKRKIGINVGWKATECNNIRTYENGNINYMYYIAEAKKLVDPLR